MALVSAATKSRSHTLVGGVRKYCPLAGNSGKTVDLGGKLVKYNFIDKDLFNILYFYIISPTCIVSKIS